MRIRLGPCGTTRGHNPFRRLPDRTVSIQNRLDCKTRKTKQEEQNAMKKIQINRAKGHAKNGKGFYIALACGLLAVGAAAWFGVTRRPCGSLK